MEATATDRLGTMMGRLLRACADAEWERSVLEDLSDRLEAILADLDRLAEEVDRLS